VKKLFLFLLFFVHAEAMKKNTAIRDFKPVIQTQPQAKIINQINFPAHVSAETGDQKTTVHMKNKIWMYLKQINAIELKNNLQSKIKTAAADLRAKSGALVQNIKEVFLNHKYKIIAGTIAFIYGFVFFKMWRAEHYCQETNTWAAWKNETPLTELLAIPQQELSEQLINDAQSFYMDEHNLTDPISPLIEFIKDIDTEIKQTQQYISLHEWIETLNIEKIFPFRAKIEALQKKLHRLAYLKNLLASWLSDYKLERRKSDLIVEEFNNPYQLCEKLLTSGYALKNKDYNPKKILKMRNPYELAELLIISKSLAQKKDAIDIGFHITKNLYYLAKFVIASSFKIDKKMKSTNNLDCLQGLTGFTGFFQRLSSRLNQL